MTTTQHPAQLVTLTSRFSGGVVMTSPLAASEVADQQAAHQAIAARNGQTVEFEVN
jgi:hypothetical protein